MGGFALVMKLSAFTLLLFFVAVTLVTVSLIGHFRPIPHISEYAYWLMTGGFAVLSFGIIFKGETR
jgi:hypothetical protein